MTDKPTKRPIRRGSRSRQMRRIFFRTLLQQFGVIWPIVSGVLAAMLGPGLIIGYIEEWKVSESLYFTFITGFTIGYGDLTPRHSASRFLAVMIGLAGIVLTGLVAAVSVQALQAAPRDHFACVLCRWMAARSANEV